jgi:hypothetical protein
VGLLSKLLRISSRRFVAIGFVLGMCVSGTLVYTASNAAFTGYTTNPGNTWTTGSVALTDDDTGVDADTGTAMFTATGLVPGATLTKCIRVTYAGTVATAAGGIKLYTSASTDTNSLLQYITMTITEGTGTAEFDGTPDCTNFANSAGTPIVFNSTLDTFIAKTNYAAGVYNTTSAWAPSSSATKVYKFAYTLSAGTPNAMQGKTATVAFRWEAQSA